MSKPLPPLHDLVDARPDDDRFHLFPAPGNRQPSLMHQYRNDISVEIKERHRRFLVEMRKELDADECDGVDSQYQGYRTVAQWAALLDCEEKTIRHYLSQITRELKKVNVVAADNIFEHVKAKGYRGYRLREGVVIVASNPVKAAGRKPASLGNRRRARGESASRAARPWRNDGRGSKRTM